MLLIAVLFLAAPIRALEVRDGVLEVLVADDFANGLAETLYFLRGENDVWRLEFTGRAPVGLRSGQRISVRGEPRGDALLVSNEDLASAARRLAVSAPADAWTQGPKRLLVILVNFSDDTSQPYTVAQAQATAFGASGSVAAYYGEVSYGSTTVSGDVAGWYTLSMPKPTTCSVFPVASAADAAAQNAGYVLSSYQFRMYVFPRIGACGWAGLGSVRGPSSWINQSFSTFVAGHELGHNYGLGHAHSLDCGAEPLGPTCTRSEYGDPFDIMGGATRHVQTASKSALGWLPSGNVATMASGSASFTLSPMEALSAGTHALRLSTDAGRTYWVEFRQAIGVDGPLSGNANVMNGALIRLAGSDLLDMTPTSTFGDAALTAGNAYTDADASLRITTVARSGGLLTVDVQYEAIPPAAKFVFSPGSPAAGQAVSFTNQSTGLPGSFLWDFGDGTTSTVRNPTHSYAAGGNYTATLTAFNAAGASLPAARTITVGNAAAMRFHTLPPCRLVDTRISDGPFGQPALAGGETRTFPLTGRCGVPAFARALAVNLTLTAPSHPGFLRLSAGGAQNSTSTINYAASQTRSNNAVVALSGSGALAIHCGQSSGSVEVVLDVFGYFE